MNIYRQKGDNPVTYAERSAGDYTSATAMAARTVAFKALERSKENLLAQNKEQILHDTVWPEEIIPDRYESFNEESMFNVIDCKYTARPEGHRSLSRMRIRKRQGPATVEFIDKVRVRHVAEIQTTSRDSYVPEHAIFMQTGVNDNKSAGHRMKELAIKQIRSKPSKRFAAGSFSIPFSRYRKGSNPVGSARHIISALTEKLSAMNPNMPIAVAVTVMIIVIMIMFSSVFTLAGDEDGNDFAYDFYEISTGDYAIVEIAEKQLGNMGGEKYWKWYGFSGHVQWCACFVSWCADQCGYIKAGIIPKFSVVGDGANWFRDKHRWANGSYSPKPGDIIFFDYEKDGVLDHVGIVKSCDGKIVTTIEGNSGDACKRQSYTRGAKSIAGYGVPVFRYPAVFDNAYAWAAHIAGDNSYHYVNWRSGDNKTHECPVCHDHPAGNYKGWNCIGFAFACWRHGAGIRCRCSCSVVSDPNWEKLAYCSSDAEANRLATRLVGVPCTVIRNGGNAIPVSELRKGDILGLFNGNTYFHTIFYEGNGKYADCTSGRSDNIRVDNALSNSTKRKIKVAIRYIG